MDCTIVHSFCRLSAELPCGSLISLISCGAVDAVRRFTFLNPIDYSNHRINGDWASAPQSNEQRQALRTLGRTCHPLQHLPSCAPPAFDIRAILVGNDGISETMPGYHLNTRIAESSRFDCFSLHRLLPLVEGLCPHRKVAFSLDRRKISSSWKECIAN
jgi:hypothetical protein